MVKKFSDIALETINDMCGSDINYHYPLVQKIGFQVFNFFPGGEDIYNEFFKDIKSKDKIFIKYEHSVKFYYFYCKEPYTYKTIQPDFKLITILSIIEFLMSEPDKKYIPFIKWLGEKIKKGEKIKDYSDFKEICFKRYLKEYGMVNKVEDFFCDYCDTDLEILKSSIKFFNNKTRKYQKVDNIKSIVKLIIGLRNYFIHEASSTHLISEEDFIEQSKNNDTYSLETLVPIQDIVYDFENREINIDNILRIFEKGFLVYFLSQLGQKEKVIESVKKIKISSIY